MTCQGPGDGNLRTSLIALLCLVVQIIGAVFLAFLVIVAIKIRREQAQIDRKVDEAVRSHLEIRDYAIRRAVENREKIDKNTQQIESILRDLRDSGQGR